MGMFELTLVGVPIVVVGVAYLLTVGRRLVPDRIPAQESQDLSVHLYLTEILILPGSSLIKKTLQEAALGRDLDLKVLQILRDETPNITPQASTRLEEGDVLLVEGERAKILQVKEMAGIGIRADVEFADPSRQPQDIGLSEVILTPGSPLIGRTLQGLRFRDTYELQVLAINRHGETLRHKMSHIRLATGDVLVVQGDHAQIASLGNRGIFRILSAIEEQHPNTKRAPIAIVACSLALWRSRRLGLVSLPVAALLGALIGLRDPLHHARRGVQPDQLAGADSDRLHAGPRRSDGGDRHGAVPRGTGDTVCAGHASPIWILSGFFALTVLLTQPMGDQAATVVILPVAIRTAWQLGLNPRSFAMMIALAASCSLLTPLEPACLLVYGPGRYRFLDYIQVGIVPAVLIYVIAIHYGSAAVALVTIHLARSQQPFVGRGWALEQYKTRPHSEIDPALRDICPSRSPCVSWTYKSVQTK